MLIRHIGRTGASALSALLSLLPFHSSSAAGDPFIPGDYAKPTCTTNFNYNAASGDCAVKPLGGFTQAQCEQDSLLKWDASTTACTAKSSPVAAKCKELPSYKAAIDGSGAAATCKYTKTLISSQEGDYVGDCFRAWSPVASLGDGMKNFLVTDQDNTNKENPVLTVVKSADAGAFLQYFPGLLSGCYAVSGDTPSKQVSADELAKSGATRRGWAYGFLTMPYKYYPGLKKFTSVFPVGGYLGWRVGQPGSAFTTALAMTVSSVKADSLDPTTGAKTGQSTDVAALSLTGGFMFDVFKDPSKRPFKVGVFVGKDRVNETSSVRYEFNKRTWYAVQIGYDFTDS